MKYNKYTLYIGGDNSQNGQINAGYFAVVKELAQRNFKAFTMFNGVGLWEQYKEDSIKIELLHTEENDFSYSDILKFCNQIKEELKQECVMVIGSNVGVDFI